jgi:hypothetical protein
MKLIDSSIMTEEEITWLDCYHDEVSSAAAAAADDDDDDRDGSDMLAAAPHYAEYAARHAHCLQVQTTLLPLLDGEDAVWLQQHTLPLRQFQARA